MNRVIIAGSRAFKSLFSGSLMVIALISMAVNALLLIALVAGVYGLLTQYTFFGDWDWMADLGLTTLAAAIAYFIYPLLLPIMVSFFDTAIADAIERDEYPQVPAKQPPYWPTLMHDFRFVAKVIIINILILPLYLLLLITGLGFVLYFVVNSYLLATEFFNIVAGRHITMENAKALRHKHRLPLFMCGMMITVSSTIPFLNLIAPMFGVAAMVHFFHALKPSYRNNIKTPQ